MAPEDLIYGYITKDCRTCRYWSNDDYNPGCNYPLPVFSCPCIINDSKSENIKRKHKYVYMGRVYLFDVCVDNNWKAETIAISESQAKNQLIYQWKKQNNCGINAKVKLMDEVIQK